MSKMIIGSDATYYAPMRAAVPATNGRRVYFPNVNEWPTQWPVSQGGSALVSIRPDLGDLFAGRLTASIRSLVESSKGHDGALTIWHEAGNLPTYKNYTWMTPQAMSAAHAYMQNLVDDCVSYGVIMCMPPDKMAIWMAPELSWYGLDIYDWPQFHAGSDETQPLEPALVTARLDDWLQAVKAVSGQKTPRLVVAETNSAYPLHRPLWFETVANWLASHNGRRFLTFWSANAGTVGPWLPGDKKTIAALNDIGERLG